MWHCFLYMRNRNGETYMAEVKETLLTAEGLKKLEEEFLLLLMKIKVH